MPRSVQETYRSDYALINAVRGVLGLDPIPFTERDGATSEDRADRRAMNAAMGPTLLQQDHAQNRPRRTWQL